MLGKDNVREFGRCHYRLGSGLGIPGGRVSSCVRPIDLERSILVPRRRIASSESSEAQLPFEECDVDVFGVMKQSTSGKCRMASTGLEVLSAFIYKAMPWCAQSRKGGLELENHIDQSLRYASQCLLFVCVWCHVWRVSNVIVAIVNHAIQHQGPSSSSGHRYTCHQAHFCWASACFWRSISTPRWRDFPSSC